MLNRSTAAATTRAPSPRAWPWPRSTEGTYVYVDHHHFLPSGAPAACRCTDNAGWTKGIKTNLKRANDSLVGFPSCWERCRTPSLRQLSTSLSAATVLARAKFCCFFSGLLLGGLLCCVPSCPCTMQHVRVRVPGEDRWVDVLGRVRPQGSRLPGERRLSKYTPLDVLWCSSGVHSGGRGVMMNSWFDHDDRFSTERLSRSLSSVRRHLLVLTLTPEHHVPPPRYRSLPL